MRRLNLILLLSAVTVALAFVISCKETNAERLEKMCGEWVSTGGKPPFTLWEEDGKYRVTVMHRNHKGDSEAETYLVRETEGVLFIETGFAVMMDYDREKDHIRLHFFGDMIPIAPELRALAKETDEITEHLSKDDFQANVCLNYGGRDEILRAARQFAADCASGKRKPEELEEGLFSSYLDSAGIPDPELIIRPSGEQRLSNFLLWQCAYSEFYFTDVLWPDFDEAELDKAIAAYQSRDRRFGGVKK